MLQAPTRSRDKYLALYPERNLSATARSQGLCAVCDCVVTDRGPATDGSDVTWGQCRTVLAMAAALDWAVGTVVDALKANAQYDNTIIFYSSDNGAQGGQGGTSYPLRGYKTQLWEGGIRVPGFVSGGSPLLPQKVEPCTFPPTFCAMGEKIDFVYLVAAMPGRHSGDQAHKVKN